jgi:hypothetical protein
MSMMNALIDPRVPVNERRLFRQDMNAAYTDPLDVALKQTLSSIIILL